MNDPIAEIRCRARAAADQFHLDHEQPQNPFAPSSDAHRAWTAAYYARGVELGMEIEQAA